MRSRGTGKTIVEFWSTPISSSVCRYQDRTADS